MESTGTKPRFSPLRQKIVRTKSFLNAKAVRNEFHVASVRITRHRKGASCYFMPLVCCMLPMRPYSAVRGTGPLCWHLPRMCSRFRAAGGLLLGHLDSETGYRDSLRAAPPRWVPALPNRSACEVVGGCGGRARLRCCHGSPQHFVLHSRRMGAALRSRPVGQSRRCERGRSSAHLD